MLATDCFMRGWENMRYYGEEYKKFITESITNAYDAVHGSDYGSHIRSVYVSSKNAGLKTECVETARTAYSHVGSIRWKLMNLNNVLLRFYNSVDVTSDTVLGSAKEIRNILSETNAALVRMNDVVNGTGKYSGEKVTPQTLKSAGLDVTKCNRLKASIWDKIFSIQSAEDKISYDAAVAFVDYINNLQKNDLEIPNDLLKHTDAVFGVYIEKIKKLDPNMVPAIDMKRLEGIYDFYVSTRDVEHFKDLNKKTLQNCVDVYEILDPDAKTKTTDLFAEVNGNGALVDLNILRIKYALYTADEEYRNAMFYYMPQLVVIIPDEDVNTYGPDKIICSDGKERNVLYLNLFRPDEKNNNFSSFFHEFGHAIDDLSAPNTEERTVYSSERFKENLVSDLRNHMRKTMIEVLKINLPDERREDLIDFFLSPENINIIDTKGKQFPYPNDWTTSQVMAFYRLREYYGYKNFIYDKDKKTLIEEKEKENNNPAHLGYSYGKDPFNKTESSGCYLYDQAKKQTKANLRYGIRDDIIGGLTNNQIGGTMKSHNAHSIEDADPNRDFNLAAAHNHIKRSNSWFDSKGARTSSVCLEYFAENWESGVLGYSTETATEVFGSARKEFEKIRDEIFEKSKPK